MGELKGFFESQHGLITRKQALSSGMTARAIDWRLQTGEWSNERPCVHRLAGVPSSWEQRLHAAMIWSHGAVSHRSAARPTEGV